MQMSKKINFHHICHSLLNLVYSLPGKLVLFCIMLIVLRLDFECIKNTLLFPLPGAAVIPLTDCCHELLPIQFVIDPGDDFVWGKDDLDPAVIQKLTITTHDKIGLLNEYLDVIQVCVCVCHDRSTKYG